MQYLCGFFMATRECNNLYIRYSTKIVVTKSTLHPRQTHRGYIGKRRRYPSLRRTVGGGSGAGPEIGLHFALDAAEAGIRPFPAFLYEILLLAHLADHLLHGVLQFPVTASARGYVGYEGTD